MKRKMTLPLALLAMTTLGGGGFGETWACDNSPSRLFTQRPLPAAEHDNDTAAVHDARAGAPILAGESIRSPRTSP